VRILYVTNGYPPHRWAGTEVYTAALARTFLAQGHDVRVLCVGTWNRGPAFFNGHDDTTHDGVQVRRLNLNWTRAADPFTWLYDNPIVARLFDAFLDEWQPEIVHVTSCETLSSSVLRVTKERGLPLLLTLTDFWFICPRIQLLRSDLKTCDGRTTAWDCTKCLARDSKAYRWPSRLLPETAVAGLLGTLGRFPILTRRPGLRGMIGNMDGRKTALREALRWPDRRMTASPFVRATYLANGVDVPIDVSAYGNDLSWLAAYPGRSRGEILRLGFVGQVIPQKGLHVLLAALAGVPAATRARMELLVYGDPAQSPGYGEQMVAQAAGLPVRFMGTFQRAELGRVLASFDVLIVPSLWYDFPLVIQEAMATRTPVVATNLGGMAEAVTDGRNGLLFEAGDARGLAGHLTRLTQDARLLGRLAEDIPPVKTIETNVAELSGVYRSLI
jgi:glycosyltransferase involved in cell wall biosynthesis